MYVCYVDESGCLGTLPSSTSPVQPVLVVTGIIIDRAKLTSLTTDFLNLKSRFFPGKLQPGRPFLDRILLEIKGNELRKAAASWRRREWNHALSFIDYMLQLLLKHDVLLISRIYIKPIGAPFRGNAAYTFSIQDVCSHFQKFLTSRNEVGLVIADNRRPAQNRNVSHSVFTQKFKTAGDEYDRILEMPTFGDSQNHAGLQLCDLVSSAVVQPIAIHRYCEGHVANLHVRPYYQRIAIHFASGVRRLQYRYIHPTSGHWSGGVVVSDGILKRPSSHFFK